MAVQETRSATYCGTTGPSISVAAGKPSRLTSSKQPAREAESGLHVPRAVQVRIVDQPLPANRGPRLLEVDPHQDHQRVIQLLTK